MLTTILLSLLFFRLLNANKIACLRVDAFQDLHNLNLLSLYDNKLQTIAKGTFSSLRAIQTLYVNTLACIGCTHTRRTLNRQQKSVILKNELKRHKDYAPFYKKLLCYFKIKKEERLTQQKLH